MKSVHAMNLLDNIFDPHHQVMEPCIIVCPTYYLEYDETAYVTPGDNPAGDGRYEGIPSNYYREIVEDLIPAAKLGIDPADCAVVEDAKEGIEAAKAGGMTAFALFGDAKGCGLEDYDLTSFPDLLNILP